MNKAAYILTLGLLLCGLSVSAQRYDRVVKDNFWNNSRNVTGIRQDSISVSYVEAYGKYESGDFRDTWEASDIWYAGATTASIRHLEKISFKGAFSFEQAEGYQMCGSMFSRPGFYPIDILEFTPGRKTRQTYSFYGGLSFDISPEWRIGASMDFESANISKRKDLRHTNWLLDMTVSPGVMFKRGDFAFGANYVFNKNSESIKAEQVGQAESSYFAFLDKGLMYGVYSVWSGSGLHLSEAGVNGFPVKNFSNGAAAQIQYKGLFAEMEYLHTQGSIGEKEYIWFRFPGNEALAMIGFRTEGKKVRHYAGIRLGWKGLELQESILEKVTENGVSTVLNHGSNRILTKESISLSPEYEIVGNKFELSFCADMRWDNSLSSQMYPYIFHQGITSWYTCADILMHLGRFDIGARVGSGGGSYNESELKVNDDSGVLSSPFRLEDWQKRHMEYLTASRVDAGVSVRFNFPKGLYLQVEGNLRKAFSLEYIEGADRICSAFRIGYDF